MITTADGVTMKTGDYVYVIRFIRNDGCYNPVKCRVGYDIFEQGISYSTYGACEKKCREENLKRDKKIYD